MDIEGLPGDPVVKIPCSQCMRLRFDSWRGARIPHSTWNSQKVKIKKKKKAGQGGNMDMEAKAYHQIIFKLRLKTDINTSPIIPSKTNCFSEPKSLLPWTNYAICPECRTQFKSKDGKLLPSSCGFDQRLRKIWKRAAESHGLSLWCSSLC